jgi:hypothetical protein
MPKTVCDPIRVLRRSVADRHGKVLECGQSVLFTAASFENFSLMEDPASDRKPLLSVRLASRLWPFLASAWLALWVWLMSLASSLPWVQALSVPFYVAGGAMLLKAVFRCPACGAVTFTTSGSIWGGYMAFWAPRSCPKCHADFTTTEFKLGIGHCGDR